ncbi:hypothetical protein KXV57_002280 [Aspergillus fumigatus]|uniref:LysM domain-containing protein n=1 Tax=Aspergillus fumigatus TaxID=746128 RepID=A0A9P8SPZ7_ASPFM|nr:hypothetical protein KXV57_002280 [Aspergillus fumigatus]
MSRLKAPREVQFLFARSDSATVGIYIGKGLQSEGVSSFALNALSDNVRTLNISSGTIAMQLYISNNNNVRTFGIFTSSNESFTAVQSAIETLSNGGCLSFEKEKALTGPAVLTTPLLKISSNATYLKTIRSSSTVAAVPMSSSHSYIVVRAGCNTVQVGGGDSCSALVTKCGISAADFSKYKPGPNLCSTLVPGQPVCCSAGTLLGFAPKPKPDRSCTTYTIRQDDNCANLAAQYSLTKEDRGLQQEDMGLEWLLKCLGRDSNLSK